MPGVAPHHVPIKLIGTRAFCRKFHIKEKDFERSNLQWPNLAEIYDDYQGWWRSLIPAARYFVNTLAIQKGVHSVSYRVKDPEHLIEKIIRKSKDTGLAYATPSNFRQTVRDLIGVRALHVFKETWLEVHQSIMANWDLTKPPEAKIRKKIDPDFVVEEFRSAGCKTTPQKSGYRSVHYEIQTQVARRTVFVELQVRTLFEEGWGEASHQTEYPYFVGTPTLERLLIPMSALAGLGDSFASAAKLMRSCAEAKTQKDAAQLQKRIGEFRQRIEHIKAQYSKLKTVLANPQPTGTNERHALLARRRSSGRA
jgi:putative GTP pyrophosphokinase